MDVNAEGVLADTSEGTCSMHSTKRTETVFDCAACNRENALTYSPKIPKPLKVTEVLVAL